MARIQIAALITALALVVLLPMSRAAADNSHQAALQALSQLERDEALPVLLGPDEAAQGALSQAGDALLYRFDAAAGRTYVIEVFDAQRGAGRGTQLLAYDGEGRYLDSGTGGYGNVNQVLILAAPADEPLFVRVSGREGWAGGFRLRVLARFDQPGAAWGEAMEPNDYCQLAAPLAIGAAPVTQGIGYVQPEILTSYSDGDSFRIDVEAGRRYEVLVDGLPPSSHEGAVSVRFHEIETGEFLGWGARSGAGGAPASIAHHTRQSGALCVRVTASFRPSHWYGPYTIQVCEGSCRRKVFLPTLRGVATE